MAKIAIINLKGGVGKSVTACNLACLLAETWSRRVLVMDLDKQGNTTKFFNRFAYGRKTMGDVLTLNAKMQDVIMQTDFERVDLAPSNMEMLLANKNVMLDVLRPQWDRLRKALETIHNDYDYCIIDCPPDIDMATVNALAAADWVIIPVDCDEWAMDGMDEIREQVDAIRDAYNPQLEVMGVLATKYTRGRYSVDTINEIANICEKVGADVRDVRTGIGSDSRIGYQFIYPGVGYGGSCFPKDVKALIRTALDAGLKAPLLQAVEDVNKHQKQHMAEIIENYFAPQGGVKGKTLALWGLAFKANTDDMREAASVDVIKRLTAEGMKVTAFDPVAADNARRIFKDNDNVVIGNDQYEVLKGAQALLVITEWNQFRNPDFDRVKEMLTAPIVFDGRNLYSPDTMARHGFAYFCIGRRADGAR